MAEANEMLLEVLQGIMTTNQQLTDTLAQLVHRQEAEHTEFVKAMERLAEHMKLNTTQLAANDKVLGEMVKDLGDMLVRISDNMKYIADTTNRTEQMTARILAEVSQNPAQ